MIMLHSLFFIYFLFSTVTKVCAQGHLFVSLSKSLDNRNFFLSLQGCNEAAAINNDWSELIGLKGSASPQPQALALEEAALFRRYDAYGFSVVMSSKIGKATQNLIELFDDGLVDGYVSIDFQTTGRMSYSVMNALVENQAVLRWNFISNRILQATPGDR